MDALSAINLRHTPQTEQADPAQRPNHAGGYSFTVDPVTRLRRFLVLGTTGGTFYVGERELTRENAQAVIDMARADPATLVAETVAVSTAGRAPKANPALFALAVAASLADVEGRRLALDALPLVARTGTHLFIFARYVEQFRGWGPALRRAVAAWYTDKPVRQLAYQAVKYQQREGWSHRDLLRLAHPRATEPERRALFDWICGREADTSALSVVEGHRRARTADPATIAGLVAEHGLSWEMLPDAALARADVWEALLDAGMPQTALIRQLPRLTNLGLLGPLSARTAAVCAQLSDPTRLRASRVHPIALLIAQRTYASGESARGDATWTPVTEIVDALDRAFYVAFDNVAATGKRTMLAVDVSASMTHPVGGMCMSAREAAAAMALVTAAVEPHCMVTGFSDGAPVPVGGRQWGWGPTALCSLPISPRQRLDDVVRLVAGLRFGRTDCALPMTVALDQGWEVDTFVVYSDSETYLGDIHPHQALQQYRAKMGIASRLAVVSMTGTQLSIADPADPGSLDVSGFDANTPALLSAFSDGSL